MSKLIVNEIEKYDAGQLTITTGTDVSVGSNLTVGGTISGTLSTAAQPNVTSVGTLSSLAVSGDLTVDTNTLYVDATNNRVGIGTSSPAALLSFGSLASGAVDGARIYLRNNTNEFAIGTNGFQTVYAGYEGHVWQTGNFGGTERMRIDSSGNVGIGTSSPVTTLSLGSGTTGVSFLSASQSLNSGKIAVIKQVEVGSGNGHLTFETYAGGAGGTERMRISSTGNVAIGTSVASAKLQINNTNAGSGAVALFLTNASTSLNTETRLAFAAHTNDDISSNRYSYISALNTSGSNGQALVFATNATGAAGTERMRIDSSGNVGIGATPTQRLSVVSDGGLTRANIINTANAAAGSGIQFVVQSGGSQVSNTTLRVDNAGNFSVFNGTTSEAERMRITSGGNVNFNGVFAAGSDRVAIGFSAGQGYIQTSASITTSIEHHYFYNPNGLVGSIATSGSSTAYNTSSDYRLKENVVEMTGALDRVDALKPSRFNFIADPEKTVDGFLAHEVQAIVPEAVTGEKDAVDEEGNPIYQGIDQSKIVPLLVGAIKELRAEIETLKSQINA